MTNRLMNVRRLLSAALLAAGLVTAAAGAAPGQSFFAEPVQDPKVDLRFDRYYSFPQMEEVLRELEQAYPKFLELVSIGKSWEGRDMWLMIVNNPDTGPHEEKTAFWVDGNIHGNEIQGVEINLYLIWFLMENYEMPEVRRLVDERAFYVLPTQNPDGRQHWFEEANTSSSSRSGVRPLDSDNDGRADEDGYDDLDGDGHITSMRKYTPGRGNMKVSDVDPRLMVRVGPGETGDWTMLGSEGIDNDGDGRINEDGPGGYDLNRNWPTDWKPDYIQRGAHWYPFSHPEARAVGEFLLAHPNVAGVQSWHNSGGMILRGPGASSYRDGAGYPREDIRAYDYIGERGELILPYYNYYIIWDDLYTVYGGFIDWTYDGLGIFSFSNELWSRNQYFNEAWDEDAPVPAEKRMLFYNDRLGLGAWYVDWHEVEHPEYGTIEVGGWSKYFNRVTVPFMLQEMCHRNAMFALFHADQMPMVQMDQVEVERLEGDTWQVTATVVNPKAIPSRASIARINRIGLPDSFTIEGRRVEVEAGGYVSGSLGEQIRLVEHDPAHLSIESGVPGRGEIRVRWIVSGSGSVTLTYRSQKGGTVSRSVDLR
ncbi:MAG: M14 family metallopeptidase [bacterium]